MDLNFTKREFVNDTAPSTRRWWVGGMFAAVALTMTLSYSADANATPLALKEILPAEGPVNPADEGSDYFDSINLVFDQTPVLSDGATVTLTHKGTGLEDTIEPNMMFVGFGSEREGYTVLLNPSEKMNLNGEYILTVPADIFKNEAGESYPGATFTYLVSGLTDAQQSGGLQLKRLDPAEGPVNAANEGWEYFENINVVFEEQPFLVDNGTVQLTYVSTGLTEEIEPNMMFSSFNDNGYTVLLLPSENMNLNGEYTLTIPAGIFKNENGESYAGGTYSYVVSGLPDGNKDESDSTPLTITQLWFGQAKDSDEKNAAGNFIPCVDMATASTLTDGMTLASIKENDAIEVEFNHSAKAKAASWRIYDNTTNSSVLSGWMGKLSNGHFTMSPGWIDIELLKGHEYSLTFRTFNQEPSQGQVEYGDGVSLTIYGDTEEFHFSDVTYIGAFPEPDSFEIKGIDDNVITLVFSDAVRINEDESSVTYGWGTSRKFDEVIYDRLNPNVVKVVIPSSCITAEDSSLRLSIAAYDYDGMLIEGTNGIDQNSRIEESYRCNVASDAPVLTGDWHRIADTSLFRVKSSAKNEYIMEGILAYPYLATTAGVKVADFDADYGFVTISEAKFEGADCPTELEFRLIDSETGKPFNRAGYYNLIFPRNTFVQGFGQMFHRASKTVSYPVEIVEFVNVDHLVAGHLNSMGKVAKGSATTFKIAPAEGWDIEKITLNGEDITESYADGVLTTPALNENAVIATDMKYNGEFFLTTGIDDVVSPLQLRAWSENGDVCVGGLKAGQRITLYTANGAMMIDETLANDGDARFKVSQSQVYIIIVNDGTQKVALKVIN